MRSDEYDGVRDAEHILEKIMHRQNWSVNVRDEIAAALVSVRRGRNLATGPRRMLNPNSVRTVGSEAAA